MLDLNQTDDFPFQKFRDELATNQMILNSTANVRDRSPKVITDCSLNNSTASDIIEEGEIISHHDATFRTVEKPDNSDCDEEDCIVVEKSIEQIIIDDDTAPIMEEEPNESIFFEDHTGSPTLKFTPLRQTRKSTPPSKRRSCTAVLNSSDVIVLDETDCCSSTSLKAHNSLDESVLFVSESAPDFIPLNSENVPKPLKVVQNPFSPKFKKLRQSLNNSLFSKSEKKALEAYNFNSYNPKIDEDKAAQKQKEKRTVIIDGSNVAFGYSLGREFSVKGLEICIEYFKKMGHEVKAVVPQMRLRRRYSTDPDTLDKLYKDGVVILTPCKNIPGNSSSSYDDRFILQLASQMDAAIVSNDNYRDLINENAAFKKMILNRVIGYTWVDDIFMIPKDPYGKFKPTLREILNRNPKKNPKHLEA